MLVHQRVVSTEVVPPLVQAAAGCWEMFHCLGDSEALSGLLRLIISADYTCTVHLAMMSWMSHKQVRKLASWVFFPIYVEATNQCFFVHAPVMCQHTWKGIQKFQSQKGQKRKSNILRKQLTRWCPIDSVQLVYNSNFTGTYDRYIYN